MRIQNTTDNRSSSHLGKTIVRIIGLLLVISSLIMIPPALIGMIYGDGDVRPFFHGFLFLFTSGSLLLIIFRKSRSELKIRSGFIVVGLSWFILGVSGAIPLYLATSMELSLVDSVFESVSALTTTGATIITQLDGLPHSILFYRQLMQWLGGMGIIVLAIAILPMLRIGGMQMFKAETPGPMKDQKLTPRIAETAKTLWYLYLGFTIMCALAYYMAGMNLFDAVGHSFSTLATGGMSTHDASIGYFNNSLIELISMIFMLVGGINFASHFTAWRSASMKVYLHDTEIKTYFGVIMFSLVFISIVLLITESHPTLYETIRHSAFNIVSTITTTGFGTEDISMLPLMVPFYFIILGTIGACAGSTSGGIKMIRVILIYKLSLRELYRLIHPHGKFIIKLDGKIVNYRVLDSVSAFFFQLIFLLMIFILLLLSFGEDLTTSVSATFSAMANLGPALGDAGSNYASLHDGSKWVLSLVMIFGRLEIFTIFLLFIPAYWES